MICGVNKLSVVDRVDESVEKLFGSTQQVGLDELNHTMICKMTPSICSQHFIQIQYTVEPQKLIRSIGGKTIHY